LNQSTKSQKITFIGILFALIPDAFNLIFNSVLNRKFRHVCKSIIFCNDYNQISQNSEPWDLVTFYNVTKRRLSSVSGISFMMKEINSNFSLGTQRNSFSTQRNSASALANQTIFACTCLSNLDEQRNMITSSKISNSSKESRPSLSMSTLNLQPHSINNLCSPSKGSLLTSNLNSKIKPNSNKQMTKNSKKNQPQVKTEQRIQKLYRKKPVTFCSKISI
jgi:outer membrane protein assembly factor BamA